MRKVQKIFSFIFQKHKKYILKIDENAFAKKLVWEFLDIEHSHRGYVLYKGFYKERKKRELAEQEMRKKGILDDDKDEMNDEFGESINESGQLDELSDEGNMELEENKSMCTYVDVETQLFNRMKLARLLLEHEFNNKTFVSHWSFFSKNTTSLENYIKIIE